jgi:hypothetical protein
MKVLFDAGSEYQDGLPINLDFSPFENEKNNLLYAFGINPGYRIVRPDRNQFKYTVYFEAEEPNGFVNGQTFNQTSLYKETQFQRNKRSMRDKKRGGRKKA